jgi:hypothetical protein
MSKLKHCAGGQCYAFHNYLLELRSTKTTPDLHNGSVFLHLPKEIGTFLDFDLFFAVRVNQALCGRKKWT